MSSVEVHRDQDIALTAEQTYWSEGQIAVLRHMGVENAAPADLQVFHHICQRTGLDPFARQIYMIGRNSREQIGGEWRTVVKYTIQTGIDGFRLIGRRAANASGQSISVEAPEWATEDGRWMPVWSEKWGTPLAARVTIKRGGEPFTAVALFSEYAQTKRDGGLTQMWSQRPAGQIAKCAEALAWRTAFPHDLSGLYSDEEMAQAENAQPQQQAQAPSSAPERMANILGPDAPTPDAPDLEGDAITSAQMKKMQALFAEANITERTDKHRYAADVLGRDIESATDLTRDEASRVIEALVAETTPNVGGEKA